MSRVYQTIIRTADKFVPKRFADTWNHPAGTKFGLGKFLVFRAVSLGPKTIHFWAPSFKWALVIAGIGDLSRPAEKLSVNQSAGLAATGCIWSRYAWVIIPRNYNLLLVNLFVGGTGILQLSRIYNYRRSLEQGEPKE